MILCLELPIRILVRTSMNQNHWRGWVNLSNTMNYGKRVSQRQIMGSIDKFHEVFELFCLEKPLARSLCKTLFPFGILTHIFSKYSFPAIWKWSRISWHQEWWICWIVNKSDDYIWWIGKKCEDSTTFSFFFFPILEDDFYFEMWFLPAWWIWLGFCIPSYKLPSLLTFHLGKAEGAYFWLDFCFLLLS